MYIEFSVEAGNEFRDAEAFYERQMSGLGTRFRLEVQVALERLRLWPLAAPIELNDIRRMVLSRFPYKLLYSVEKDFIYIIAVAHSHRAPDYWIERKLPN